jgi:putative ATP-dependent endonuclease of OLD family
MRKPNSRIGEGPGAARVNTLPLAIEDMLQRTGIVIRNEELRPWLPLRSP